MGWGWQTGRSVRALAQSMEGSPKCEAELCAVLGAPPDRVLTEEASP